MPMTCICCTCMSHQQAHHCTLKIVFLFSVPYWTCFYNVFCTSLNYPMLSGHWSSHCHHEYRAEHNMRCLSHRGHHSACAWSRHWSRQLHANCSAALMSVAVFRWLSAAASELIRYRWRKPADIATNCWSAYHESLFPHEQAPLVCHKQFMPAFALKSSFNHDYVLQYINSHLYAFLR